MCSRLNVAEKSRQKSAEIAHELPSQALGPHAQTPKSLQMHTIFRVK